MDDIKLKKDIKKEIKNAPSAINLRDSTGLRGSAFSPRQSAIEWQAPAFKYYPKDVSWYWMSFIIAILLIAFAVLQKNFLFAVFIFLAEISVLILGRSKPETLKFKIDEKGVTIVDKTYLFSDLEKFCLRSDNEYRDLESVSGLRESASSPHKSAMFEELIIKRKTHFNPYLKIFVDSRVASQVRDILSQKLTEEEYEDSLIESIFKWLRF